MDPSERDARADHGGVQIGVVCGDSRGGVHFDGDHEGSELCAGANGGREEGGGGEERRERAGDHAAGSDALHGIADGVEMEMEMEMEMEVEMERNT